MSHHGLDSDEFQFRDGPVARELAKSAEALASYIENLAIFQKRRADNRLGSVTNALRCFHWAWPLKQQSVPINHLDRRKPLLGGPLFTSSQFDWPSNQDGFLQPIAQIDLDVANELSGLNLGHGMLQIWTDEYGWNSHIRIVPKEHIETSDLADIPQGLSESANLKGAFSDVMADWDKDYFRNPQQIIGIGAKILTWPYDLYWMLSDIQVELNGKHGELIHQFLKNLPDEPPTPTPHLFGNFRGIQYSENEKPPCLLSLASEDPFCWGDGGTAQVFFDPVRKIVDVDGHTRTSMYFEWSCG